MLEYNASLIPPGTLSSPSAPSLTLEATVGTDSQLFQGAAFDKNGNLWASVICSYVTRSNCTQYYSHIVEFKGSTVAGLIGAGGTVTKSPDYDFSVPGAAQAPSNSAYTSNDTYFAGGVGFDGSGNLWVGVGPLSNATGNLDLSGQTFLFQYAQSDLGNNAPLPLNEFSLGAGAIGFQAFWPIPPGLPLY